mgnify:CR=1 FL=1
MVTFSVVVISTSCIDSFPFFFKSSLGHELEIKQLDEEPEAFAERFYKAVKEVNDEANSIWNDTHGCKTCAKHWHGEGWETGEYGRFEGNDGITPIWTDCPTCQGCGVCI